MPGRSRRAAARLAEELLQKSYISDADILAVLELWYFKQSSKRINVLPAGANFIHSDTLGLVRTRTGTVVTTRVTVKYSHVFHLLATWLKDNLPKDFKSKFPFTSIAVNYAYAARLRS